MMRWSELPMPLWMTGGNDQSPGPGGAGSLGGGNGLVLGTGSARHMVPSLLAVAALGFLGIVALLHLAIRDPDSSLAMILPIDPDRGGRLVALLAGSTALALGVGLWRRKRLAWHLAVVTFAVAFGVQFSFVHHPWGAALSFGIVVVLVIARKRFDVRSAPIWGRLAIVSILGVAGLALAAGLLGLHGGSPGAAAESVLGDVVAGIASALGVDDGAKLRVLHDSALAIMSTATGIALVVAHVLILLGLIGELNPAPDRPAQPAAVVDARAMLRREGRGALLPFQEAVGMSHYLSRSGRSLLAHARAGRMDVVLGDPIGSPGDMAAAIGEFVEEARLADHTVAVYQAAAASRGILLGAGFERIFRIGQEAIVDLATFGLDGPPRANLRHTVTRFHRDGAIVRWFANGLEGGSLAELSDRLAAIDAAWRRKAGPELGFSINSFRAADLPTTPIAVAIDPSEGAVAFVTFRATGLDGGYVVDLIRRLPGSIPGAVETCIAEAAVAMRDARATRLSLGLAPIHGLDRRQGPLEERVIRTAADAVRRWYDVDGLAFFKDKFHPSWEPRFVAARNRRDVLAVSVALLRLHLSPGGTLRGVAWNLVGTLFRRVPRTGVGE